MKYKGIYKLLPRISFVLVVSWLVFGCHHSGNPVTKGGTTNENKEGTEASNAGSAGLEQPEDEDEALIWSTENQVFLRSRGRANFVQIVKNVPFHSGDILRVGNLSKAIVFCKGLCELGTGEYAKCCTSSCQLTVGIQPPSGGRKFFLLRKDLKGDEARFFEEQESGIARLGLGKSSTQFLRASLYTSWKLREAVGEVQSLDEQLDKPEASQELSQIYPAVMIKTGDLLEELNQTDKAIERYKKAIVLSPTINATADRSATEKGVAHSRLAEIYARTGRKSEAVESLNHAKEIFAREGDQKKVTAVDRKMLMYKEK